VKLYPIKKSLRVKIKNKKPILDLKDVEIIEVWLENL